MAVLFERDVKTIGKHINNALKEELAEQNSVVAKFATTASDNKNYMVEHYNLDVIISVGYRVKSKRGVEFRHWTNSVLKDYIIKGYAMNHNQDCFGMAGVSSREFINFFFLMSGPAPVLQYWNRPRVSL